MSLVDDFNKFMGNSNPSPSTGKSKLDNYLGGALKGQGTTFEQAGKNYGVDPNLLAAIAIHETGNGTSNAVKSKNNTGGMMGNGGLMNFNSLTDGIYAMARNLSKNYIKQGLADIPSISKKYAPIGAANDPTGLNNHWVSGVTKYYNMLGGKGSPSLPSRSSEPDIFGKFDSWIAETKKKNETQAKAKATPDFTTLEAQSVQGVPKPVPQTPNHSLWDETKQVGNNILNTYNKVSQGVLNAYDKTLRPAIDEAGSTLLDNPIGHGLASSNPFLESAIQGMTNRAKQTTVQNPLTAFEQGYQHPEQTKSAQQLFNENYTGGVNIPGPAEILKIPGLKTPGISDVGGMATGAIFDPLNVPVLKAAKFAGQGISKLIDAYKAKEISQQELQQALKQRVSDLKPNSQKPLGVLSKLPEAPKVEGNLNPFVKPDISGFDYRPNPYRKEFEQAVNTQYNQLKNDLNNLGGVEQGKIFRDDFGDVIDRQGRVSNNPVWYQEFYKANGRRPNNTELKNIAREQVSNGYKSEMGDVPAWKPKVAQDLNNEIQDIHSILEKETDPVVHQSLKTTVDELQKEHDNIMNTFKERPIKQEAAATKTPEGVKGFFGKSALSKGTGTSINTITRKQLVDNIKKYLGVPIRTGRLGVKGAQGIFKVKPEVIRSQMDKDIGTIAHEIGHYLEKKHGLVDPAFDAELRRLAHPLTHNNPAYGPQDVLEEGLAEFFRLYLTDTQKAIRMAPNLFRHIQGKLPKDILKGLESTKQDVQTWINQGEAQQFRGKVNRTGKERNISIKDKVQKIYTQFVDAANPFAVVEKKLNGGKLNSAENSLYKKSRLYAGTPRIAEQQLKGLEKIIKPLEEKGYSVADLGDYTAAKHALELEQQGIQSGFTIGEIQSTIRKFQSPEMDAAQKQIVQYSNDLLDILVKSGRISQKAVNEMRKKYPDYVPFYRFFEEDLNGGQGNGKGFANVTNPIKRLKGSSRDIIDPIESLIKNTFAVVNAAKKNEVGKELLKLSDVDGAGKFIERVEGGNSSKENILTVYEKGEPIQLQLDPELYRATLNMDKEVANSVVRLLSTFASSLRAGATLTPEFMLRNPIRDQFHAFIVSKNGYNPFWDLPKGIYHMLNKDDVYQEWIKQGGAHGQYLSQDRDLIRKELKKLHNKPGAVKALNIVNPKQWISILRRLSEMSEEGTKVGEFNRGIKKKGLTPEEAAFRSRDLLDFSRVGNSVQQANRVVAFLNANLQGKDVLIRAFKDNPVRTSMKATMSITLPTMGLYLLNSSLTGEAKENYENIPQWQKDTFFIIPIPGTNEFARLPKPFDLAPAFSNLPEQIFRYMQDNHPEDWKKFVWNMTKESASVPIMLTGLTPIIENLANYSFFMDTPIVPLRDQDLLPKDQYGNKTSLTARFIGDKINASPYKVDNLIRGYGAGLGSYATNALDKGIEGLGILKKAPEETSKWKGVPLPDTLINAFTAQTTGSGKFMNDFYDRLDEVSKGYQSAKKNGEKVNPGEYKSLNKFSREISQLRSKYRDVQGSFLITPDQKRAQLDQLDKLMNNLAQQALKMNNGK